MERFSDDPGSPENWAAFKAFNRAAREGRLAGLPPITHEMPQDPESDDKNGMEARIGQLTSWVLTKNGLSVDTRREQNCLARWTWP